VCAIGAASCATGDDDPPATRDAGELFDENAVCERAIAQANNDLTAIESAFTEPCFIDEDCAVSRGRATCADGRSADMGDFAYATARFDEVEAMRDTHADTFCASECPNGFHIDTFIADAYCREGACRGTTRHIDEFCAGGLPFLRGALSQHGLDVGCTHADDCALVDVRVECAESANVYAGCPSAVVVGNEETFEELLQQLQSTTYCQSGFVCTVVEEGCTPVELACESSRCTTRPLRVIAD